MLWWVPRWPSPAFPLRSLSFSSWPCKCFWLNHNILVLGTRLRSGHQRSVWHLYVAVIGLCNWILATFLTFTISVLCQVIQTCCQNYRLKLLLGQAVSMLGRVWLDLGVFGRLLSKMINIALCLACHLLWSNRLSVRPDAPKRLGSWMSKVAWWWGISQLLLDCWIHSAPA